MFRIILLTSLLLSVFTVTFGQETEGNTNKGVLKTGTEFSVTLESPIDVTTTKVGSDLNFKLAADLKGEGLTIPKGTEVIGRVVEIQKVSTAKNISKVGMIFDFIKNGEDFILMSGVVTSIEGMPEGMKYDAPENLSGVTNISMEGKNILIEKGKQFNIKLTKDCQPD